MKPIAFTFDEDNHIYKVAGKEIPGTTRVIDTGGWDDYKNVREDILEKKSRIGRAVHRATFLLDKGTLDLASVDPRIAGYVSGYQTFKRVTQFVFTSSEIQQVCDINGLLYGLTIDGIGYQVSKSGKRSLETIVEKKTTVAKSERHDLQTAGYAAGYPKKGVTSALARFRSRQRLILYLRPKGDPLIHECKDHYDYDIFMHLLAISHFKLRKRKMEREGPRDGEGEE